jgi:hypothetical protein
MLSVASFKETFQGNYSVKGVTNTKAKNNTGKLEATCYLDKSSITNEDIIAHLDGKRGLGMSPIDDKGEVHFGVIDIDTYTNVVEDYIRVVYTFNVPLTLFYSKSKGLHAYVFFSEPCQPTDVVDLLIKFRILLGLPKDTEIFPKQRSADKTSFGSWINLPYFAAADSDNCRKMIREDGTLAPLEEALSLCRNSAKTIRQYEELLNALPLADAPPCLQTIYMRQRTDFRNEYLFSLATYYKTKYEDNFEGELIEANNNLIEPIELDRLDKTVISSHQKKNYSYKCGSAPLNILCNKATCRERKVGITGENISSLNFEEFIQYETDPPYYEWVVNGVSLKFFKESDIINQSAFREACFRKLHKLPNKLSDPKWTRIVNDALANVVVKEVDKESDISTGGMWLKAISEFFSKRVPAANKSQLALGRSFKDEAMKCYIFNGATLLTHLRTQTNFKAYSDVEVQAKLKDLNAQQIPYDLENGKVLKLWSIPLSQLDLDSASLDEVSMDFYDKLGEDEKY